MGDTDTSVEEQLAQVSLAVRAQADDINGALSEVGAAYQSLSTAQSERSNLLFSLQQQVQEKSVELDTYSGSSSDVTFDEFIARFELVAAANSWNPNKKKAILPLYLTKNAYQAFQATNERDRQTYDSLKEALRRKLHLPETALLAAEKLSTRRQRVGERVDDYAYDIRRLANSAYSHLGEQALNYFKLQAFLRNLAPYLRMWIVSSEAANFEEALQKARKLEARMGVTSVQTSSNVEPAQAPTAVDLLNLSTHIANSVSKQVEEAVLSSRDRSPDRTEFRDRCFCCSEYGHYAAQCPLRYEDPPLPDCNSCEPYTESPYDDDDADLTGQFSNCQLSDETDWYDNEPTGPSRYDDPYR